MPQQAALLQQFALKESVLTNEISKYLQRLAQKIDWMLKRIRHPGQEIQNQLQRVMSLEKRLKATIQQVVREKEVILKNAFRALQTVSPLATLGRGYAIVSLGEEEEASATGQKPPKILQSVEEITVGENVDIRLADGIVRAKTQTIVKFEKKQAESGLLR